jgi:subtilisin family serine protease
MLLAAAPIASSNPALPDTVAPALSPSHWVRGAAAGPYRAEVVLAGFREGVSTGLRYARERAAGAEGARLLGPAVRRSGRGIDRHVPAPTYALSVPAGGVAAVVAALRRDPEVAYAEPDYLMQASATPNDPSFGVQWADHNTGQAIPTQGSNEALGSPAPGTPGAEDGALKAWSVTTGSASIVIGETDTGVNYEHPDLAANIWSNPGGIGGCAAGTHGYSVVSHTCNPMDDDTVYGGHGTHVAGIMGAVGNNGIGVAGMNWTTSILPVKWLNSSAWGETSGLIEALQWVVAAKQAGVNVRVVNDSATFSGTAYSQALSNEIDTLGANNILFVTAAGNSGQNNDEEAVRRYPCGYDRPTELCVTATDNNDLLPSWANYGSKTVDLGAPGVSIYSTLREGGYGYLSGGSMASPQVAGAAALILSVEPSLTASELKADIVAHVDKLPALEGKTISGGRLDVCNALPGCNGPPPPPPPSTFGKTSVGSSSDSFSSNRKRVNRYSLPVAGSVSKLSIYLQPTGTKGSQAMEGIIYSDSSGKPLNLLATTSQLTFSSTNAAGWYELAFAKPVELPAGNYWIGIITGATGNIAAYRYDTVTAARDYNANTYTSGPSSTFGSVNNDSEQTSLYATYTAAAGPASAPANTGLPAISGEPTAGKTLTASTGSWSESPTGYSYQWLRCSSTGSGCAEVAGATSASYLLGSADVGATLRVAVKASNAAGTSQAATSQPTEVITAAPPQTATFGNTGVGPSSDTFAANRKRVNRYALPAAGKISKLSVYLQPTSVSGSQAIEGIIYSDSSGTPANLLATTSQLTFSSTNTAGWYELAFAKPVELPAGNYWIGVITGNTGNVAGYRYNSVTGARDYNSNTYTSGPESPFGSFTSDAEQMSLYATYTSG